MAKTFGIVETLAHAPERTFTVSELAASTGINKATATRILKDLLEAGYASQVSMRQGYSLGPMAYYLASRGRYRRDLVDAAAPVVSSCAREIGGAALVAVLRAGRRFVVCHENGNPEFSIPIENTFYDDLYITATGKMLLAYASDDDVRKYIVRNGLPGSIWDGLDSEAKLTRRLLAIRKDALLAYSRSNLGLRLYSFPIFSRGRFDAVLGFCLPLGEQGKAMEARLLSLGRDATHRIETALEAHAVPGFTKARRKRGN